ncbi:dihydroxyacetone kinase phosphoryl donor subunit DhaM [Nocardia sp. NPDC049190]|uniref:dihydroxyacetone kinase phosphoryl donor subunit DhaM n=1 Tax=Nocardia sp. NPDC049190 TaxID=3155650 RepID=UPI0033D1F648
MIGIVVVSHSRLLARAAVALAAEMLHEQRVRIEVAAGLDEQTFGTDAVAVAEAIVAADAGDGVLVLMDMGSAVLSAELALELLDPPHRVRLCAAPIVEGLIAASVSAAGGADLDEAAGEAVHALLGKRAHLGELDPTMDGGESAAVAAGSESDLDHRAVDTFVVTTAHGLHARPAARLVAAVRRLGVPVMLRNLTTGAGPASGTSLTRIAALGALTGHEIEVVARGPGARSAVDQVLAVALRGFGEAPATASVASAAQSVDACSEFSDTAPFGGHRDRPGVAARHR